jgi:hypothetical protein
MKTEQLKCAHMCVLVGERERETSNVYGYKAVFERLKHVLQIANKRDIRAISDHLTVCCSFF